MIAFSEDNTSPYSFRRDITIREWTQCSNVLTAFYSYDAVHESSCGFALSALSIFGARGFTHVTGTVNPHEKVSGL